MKNKPSTPPPHQYHLAPPPTVDFGMCNAVQKNGRDCKSKEICAYDGYLSVCKRHQKQRIAMGRCQYTNDTGDKCGRTIALKQLHVELCSAHLDPSPRRCYFMELPTEVRIMIFRHVLPDKPVAAWPGRHLRKDRIKCTVSVLRLNKQTSTEALEVLYGSAPFTVNLTNDHIHLCGRIYPLPKGTEASVIRYGGCSPLLQRDLMLARTLAATPPMLSKIRSLRLQTVFVKARFSTYEEHTSGPRNDEAQVQGMRDSIRHFTSILLGAKTNHLRNISFFLVTQCMSDIWDEFQLLNFYDVISGPLRLLNGLNRVLFLPLLDAALDKSDDIYGPLRRENGEMMSWQIHPFNLRKSIPAMILPLETHPTRHSHRSRNFRSRATGRCFILPISARTGPARYSSDHLSAGIVLEARLDFNDDFTILQSELEAALTSPRGACPSGPSPNDLPAGELYNIFQYSFHEFCYWHIADILPRGEHCYLHQARVARDKNDWLKIVELHRQLKSVDSQLWGPQLAAMEAVQNGIKAMCEAYDMLADETLAEEVLSDEALADEALSERSLYFINKLPFDKKDRETYALRAATARKKRDWLTIVRIHHELKPDIELLRADDVAQMTTWRKRITALFEEFDTLADKALGGELLVDEREARWSFWVEQEGSRKRTFQDMSESSEAG